MPKSIRRRLPFSYAAIALLATLALGVELILAVRGYYIRVERDYLTANAQAIGTSLAELLEEGASPDIVQAQIDSFSFLSQTHVRLLDTGGGEVAVSDTSGYHRFEMLPQAGDDIKSSDRRTEVVVVTVPRPADMPYPVAARGQPTTDGSDSEEVVQLPINGSQGNLLGYVELSKAVTYTPAIVGIVAAGWLIASAVGVALAAVVGWFISLRLTAPLSDLTAASTSLANGDLGARVDVARQDELGTLARSFNLMAARLEGTVASLRRFVSDAAHEIHTPLTALRTNLELARQDSAMPDGCADTLEEHISTAQAQAERLQALADGLLDLSRLESETGARLDAPVALVPLVQELGEVYASQADQVGQNFDLSIGETTVTVNGDERQLSRALSNLLDNAIKFTPEGGSVCMGLRLQGETAIIWVEDTGIGILENDMPHLFERFHRGRNASGYPGSGLGLAIVEAIVEGHGGSVQAVPKSRGVRFNISLPISNSEEHRQTRSE